MSLIRIGIISFDYTHDSRQHFARGLQGQEQAWLKEPRSHLSIINCLLLVSGDMVLN